MEEEWRVLERTSKVFNGVGESRISTTGKIVLSCLLVKDQPEEFDKFGPDWIYARISFTHRQRRIHSRVWRP
ncbi:MAG TPA: hypothetical protein DDW68_11585 [Verrucomicrobiales bacterium]|nr:hypothetical protein [Verrucomicrobiales bacterium]